MQDKRFLITGGTGFLGKFVTSSLKRIVNADDQIFSIGSADCDLCDGYAAKVLFDRIQPDIVIHLAAIVGGIGANIAQPADFFRANALMGMNVLHEALLHGVQKTVIIGTACSYPSTIPVPFHESALWDGYPEVTNAPYAIAKKMLMTQSDAYRRQCGFRSTYLILSNLYGPGDKCDSEKSHVIPSIIRKCLEALQSGSSEIELWGDGSPTRDFLYVEDGADAIVNSIELYDDVQALNIGSGSEISIRDLTALICDLTGFKGKILWDNRRPNGQMRRCLDISRAKSMIAFKPSVSLHDGLKRTIDYYKAMMTKSDQYTREDFSFLSL